MSIALVEKEKKTKRRKTTIDSLYVSDEIIRRKAKDSFYDFYRSAWSTVWPDTKFNDNWHYEVLSKELHKQVERIGNNEPKDYDIIINVPPRTSKSTLVSIVLAPWAWLHFPEMKFISASYNEKLALDLGVRSRRLIESEWYRRLFLPEWYLLTDQNVKGHWENTRGGYRIATSVNGIVGFGCNMFVIDDPMSREDSQSPAKREAANDFVQNTVPTRLNEPDTDLIILVMQRLHEEDTTGDILQREGKSWKHFCFPSDLTENSDDQEVKPLEYKSKYVNGLLFPNRLNEKVLRGFKKKLGSFVYASQFRQSALPAGGNLFKTHWWNYWKLSNQNLPSITFRLEDGTIYTPKVVNLPETFEDIVLSGDMTFKGSEGTDRVSLQAWGRVNTNKFLLDQILGQMTFIETIKNCLLLYDNYSNATSFLVEEAANGPAVISALDEAIPVFKGVKPLGSKISRVVDSSKAMSTLTQCENGHLFLPHPALISNGNGDRNDNDEYEDNGINWVLDYRKEFAVFPKGRYDDQLDATTQAVQNLTDSTYFGLYTSGEFMKEYGDLDKDEIKIIKSL